MKRFWVIIISAVWVFMPLTLTAAEKGNVYRHPAGLSFWYPQTWTLNELDEALQLVPADAVMAPEGPSEFYFVTGESIAGTGIVRADDPQVISYMDQQVRSVLPGLQLQNSRKPIDVLGNRGLVLTWHGSNNAGKAIEGRAYIVVSNGFALTLSGLAFKGLIDKRTDTLTKIVTSFVIAEGNHDPALVGTWNKHATASLSNPDRIYQTAWSAAQSVSEDKTRLTFYPDGRWLRVTDSHTLVGAGGIWLEDKSRNEHKGRWNADGKKLFLLYEDNTWEEFAYSIVNTAHGRELRTSVGTKAVIWRE